MSPTGSSPPESAHSPSPTRPGHEQYTRNMATGASTCELAVILVDARKGVLPQTRRHAFISSLLGIRHLVLAVNKMDLVGFERAVLRGDRHRFFSLRRRSRQPVRPRHPDCGAIRRQCHRDDRRRCRGTRGQPCSNISIRSKWPAPTSERPFRFPVQWVNRPNERIPRFLGNCRVRLDRAGRRGPGGRLGPVRSRQRDRHLRRHARACRRGGRGHPHARQRDRHCPRRSARRPA